MIDRKNTGTKSYFLSSMLVCFFVVIVCYFFGVHQGLNTRITAGAYLDFTNMSIALSRIWFHLHEGYIGYRQVFNAISDVFLPDHDFNNFANFYRLNDPAFLQRAFDAVKHIPGHLAHYSIFSSEFVSVNMEDLGLADFYTLAFMIFGVLPTAMYNFYFLIFSISILLFLSAYKRHLLPLMLLAIVISIFPIFFFSNFFSISLPSVNANRFMSSLGFVPILHVVCMMFRTEKLDKKQIVFLICQGLIFAFAVSIRRTASWQLIALLMLAGFVAFKIFWPYRKKFFKLEHLRLLQQPFLASTLIFVITVSSYQALQNKMLNPIYNTDCAPNGHAIWHSAFLGLQMHPDWPKYLKAGDTAFGDGAAFSTFENYMKKYGLNYICPMTNEYLYRLHEYVIRHKLLNFLAKHKMFALELYGYYKPLKLFNNLKIRLLSVSNYCIIFFLLLSSLVGILLAHQRGLEIKPRKIIFVTSLFLITSWLPLFFAYPITYTPDDFWMFVIFVCVCCSMLTFSLARFASFYLLSKDRAALEVN